MRKLLYIEASPSKSRSNSIAVAKAFLEVYSTRHPDDEVTHLDLWRTELPPFDAETIDAKFAVLRKKNFTVEQLARWESVRAVSRNFNTADKYVFSLPMWNFGIPYPLKHFIDVVTLPGENWTWSKTNGYEPLLSAKKAVLVYSGANEYLSDSNASDFQKPYMRRWLRFIGVYDVSEIVIAPTLAEPEGVAEIVRAATQRAKQLAEVF
jgi:FMN-dependent NADH-azoreductase